MIQPLRVCVLKMPLNPNYQSIGIIRCSEPGVVGCCEKDDSEWLKIMAETEGEKVSGRLCRQMVSQGGYGGSLNGKGRCLQ